MLATHKETGEQVAAKIIEKKHLKANTLALQRQEIEILKKCQHPNIVRLFDVFESGSKYVIILEHLEGGDLLEYFEARDFSISESRAKEIIK